MISFVDPDRYDSLKATGKLPSPKGVAFSIIKLLQRDDFRVPDLVQLVQSDPAIAGRLLKFANAAAFGRTRPIVSLQRAIVALGAFRVRDLVISLSVMHSHTSGQCAAFDYAAFWGHSLATGIACQELAHFAQISSEEIFTIGLLARVGELAMASLYPDEYATVLLKAQGAQSELASLERERFAMDHLQLGATMLAEWGMPEMLIHAAYHHEEPDVADFADGSRLQTLTHSLNFARSLAEVCMADEESRWSLLPGLLTRAARLGISGDALNDMVDRMVRRWREWGATLQVRTQEMPPFAEILAASPPSRRVSSSHSEPSGKVGAPRLQVQLLGIPSAELPELLQQIEELGHRPMLIDGHDDAIMQALRQPARIVIAEMAMPGLQPAALCRLLRQTPAGKETYLLLLASPQGDSHILEAIDAGADDVLVKPVTLQTLRVRLNTATRMLLLRDEIQRERRGIMRSTDQFAVAHKRLLREALTDTLTQLPNRMGFRAVQRAADGLPATRYRPLQADQRHPRPSRRRRRPAATRRPAQTRLAPRGPRLSLWRRRVRCGSAQCQCADRRADRRTHSRPGSEVRLPLAATVDPADREHRCRHPEQHGKGQSSADRGRRRRSLPGEERRPQPHHCRRLTTEPADA